MSVTPTAQDVLLYHRATGCPVATAKATLEAMAPELRARVLLASCTQSGRAEYLRDPIENDEKTEHIIRLAAKDAQASVTSKGMGRCHAVWREQARILMEQHGVKWYSPQEMNPDIFFD